jgi:hypothetical protein
MQPFVYSSVFFLVGNVNKFDGFSLEFASTSEPDASASVKEIE